MCCSSRMWKVGEFGKLGRLRGEKIVFCERLKRKEERSRRCVEEWSVLVAQPTRLLGLRVKVG